MGEKKNDMSNECHEENQTYRISKWFSLKRRVSGKKRDIQNILEKQVDLNGRLTELTDDRKGVLLELATTNKHIVEMTNKISELLAVTDHRKEFEHELKRQLKESRNEHVAQADELRTLHKERHKLELENCRLEALVKKLSEDLQQANRNTDKTQDLSEASSQAPSTYPSEEHLFRHFEKYKNI